MERTTRKHVESAFKAFVNEIGGHIAASYSDVGGYQLDYAACYGGYQVVQIVNDAGGQTCPFGYQRRSAREMADMLWFATEVLRVKSRMEVSK